MPGAPLPTQCHFHDGKCRTLTLSVPAVALLIIVAMVLVAQRFNPPRKPGA